MEETFIDKIILKKLSRKGKSLAFYIIVNKAKTSHNLKGMIGMLVTSRHVWGHAYGHDIYV